MESRVTIESEGEWYLDTVVAGSDAAVLDLDVGGRVRELALRVGSGALVALELPADLELEPSRVLAVEQIVHVHHSHGQRRWRWQGSVGRGGRGEGNARDTHHLCGRGVQIITGASGRRHYGRYRLAVF